MVKLKTRRYKTEIIEKKLDSKLVFLTGPLQCGKTNLSKGLYPTFRSLKAKFPKVEAVQVVFRSDIDIRNVDGIRIVGTDIFLREFI